VEGGVPGAEDIVEGDRQTKRVVDEKRSTLRYASSGCEVGWPWQYSCARERCPCAVGDNVRGLRPDMLSSDEVQSSLPRSDYSAWVLKVSATRNDLTATVERGSNLLFSTYCFLAVEVEDCFSPLPWSMPLGEFV
jgi:hypothetical protein